MASTVSDKQEILNEISNVEKDLENLLPKINTFDAILTLLSYYEIIINELSSIARQIEEEQKYNYLIPVLFLRNQSQTLHSIHDAIDFLLLKTNELNELSRTPPIETVCTNADFSNPELQLWLEKHYDPKVDWLYPIQVQMGAKLMTTRFICVQKFHEISENHQIKLTFLFFEYFCKRKALRTLIEHNIKAKIRKNKFGIDMDLTDEEILSKEKMHPRFLDSSPHSFPMYKTEHVELGKKTLLSTRLKAEAPLQRDLRRQEIMSFYNEFLSLPEFPEKFKTKFGVTLKDFSNIVFTLRELALKYDTAVCHFTKQRLIIKVKKLCKCSKQNIEKVIDLLTWKNADKTREKPIFTNGIDYFYSGSMINMPSEALVNLVFDEYNDGNFQGLEFEKECRRVFEKDSSFVFNDRLKINKQILSDEVSLDLFGRIKRRTDIDVIGSKNRFLFVLECKSEHPHFKKSWERQLNRFEKYYSELLHKSKWIVKNYNEFVRITQSQNCNLPNNIKFIIPLLVTSFVTTEREKILVVTQSELEQIIKKLPQNFSGNNLEILLNSNTKIQIPILNIN